MSAHSEPRRVRLKLLLEEPLAYGANEPATDDNADDPRYIRITDITSNGELRDDTRRSLDTAKAAPYLLRDDDLLLARSGATVGKAFRYRSHWGKACYAGYLIRARVDSSRLDPTLLHYFTESSPYWQYVKGTEIQSTIQNVSAERYANLPVPVPPIEDQPRIADFLDRETAKIDALIAKQEQLIATLQEDRIATITHAVTRGLRQDTDTRESGVQWIGRVPAHWVVDRLKWSVESSKNGYWGAEPEGAEGIRCIRVADFDRPRLSIHDNNVTYRAYTSAEFEGAGLRAGDLLLEKSGGGEKSPVGFVAIYESEKPAVCSNFIARLRVAKNQMPRYWLYVHAWLYARRLTAPSIKQNTGIQNLDEKSYLDTLVSYPPLSEQAEIVEHLDIRCRQIDSTIAHAAELVARLHEFRSALITDAVTGTINVREMV